MHITPVLTVLIMLTTLSFGMPSAILYSSPLAVGVSLVFFSVSGLVLSRISSSYWHSPTFLAVIYLTYILNSVIHVPIAVLCSTSYLVINFLIFIIAPGVILPLPPYAVWLLPIPSVMVVLSIIDLFL